MREMEMPRRIERTIAEKRLLEPGERLVVAVSGGPDSIALLHLLSELRDRYGWAISAAHINHSLRGAESDEEEAYVRSVCERLSVPCFVTRVDVYGNMPIYGNNLQATARALRYRALRVTADTWRTNTVALGHHGDDQAETVLMRLLRGTGPGGLAGIRWKTTVDGMKLIRPLLRITKSELEAYCDSRELEPRFDSSNASRHYFRNIIRLDILPYIMKLREGAAESLRRVAEMSADEDDFMDKEAHVRLAEIVRFVEGAAHADRKAFQSVPIALQRRMIKIILSSLNLSDDSIDYAKIERIRETIAAESPTTAEHRIGEHTVFRRSYEALEWAPYEPDAPEPYLYRIDIGDAGALDLPGIGARLEWSLQPKLNGVPSLDEGPFTAWFDAGETEGPWVVRTRRPGDRMAPLGLNGTRKVKDIFVDGKLPKRLRDQWPIVTDRNGAILWVPGFRRSRFATVEEETGSVIQAKLLWLESDVSAESNLD